MHINIGEGNIQHMNWALKGVQDVTFILNLQA